MHHGYTELMNDHEEFLFNISQERNTRHKDFKMTICSQIISFFFDGIHIVVLIISDKYRLSKFIFFFQKRL